MNKDFHILSSALQFTECHTSDISPGPQNIAPEWHCSGHLVIHADHCMSVCPCSNSLTSLARYRHVPTDWSQACGRLARLTLWTWHDVTFDMVVLTSIRRRVEFCLSARYTCADYWINETVFMYTAFRALSRLADKVACSALYTMRVPCALNLSQIFPVLMYRLHCGSCDGLRRRSLQRFRLKDACCVLPFAAVIYLKPSRCQFAWHIRLTQRQSNQIY